MDEMPDRRPGPDAGPDEGVVACDDPDIWQGQCWDGYGDSSPRRSGIRLCPPEEISRFSPPDAANVLASIAGDRKPEPLGAERALLEGCGKEL